MDHFQDVAILPLNQQSVIAIDNAIKGYLAVIVKVSAIPLESIQKLRAIRVQLVPFVRPGGFPEDTVLFLSHDELWLIAEAIEGFVESARLIIPSSAQRDAVLQEFEKLRQYVQIYLTQDMN